MNKFKSLFHKFVIATFKNVIYKFTISLIFINENRIELF